MGTIGMSGGAAEEEAGPAETGRTLQGLRTGAAQEEVRARPWWAQLYPKRMMGTILYRRPYADLPKKLEPMSRLQASGTHHNHRGF